MTMIFMVLPDNNFTIPESMSITLMFAVLMETILMLVVLINTCTLEKDVIKITEEIPIYQITESGIVTDYYAKLTEDKDIIINYGDIQKVANITKVIRNYEEKPYIEKTITKPDETKFPNNISVNIATSMTETILHVGEIR